MSGFEFDDNENDYSTNISEESQQVLQALISKNVDVKEAVNKNVERPTVPYGKLYQDDIKNNSEPDTKKDKEYPLPKTFKDGKHKKTCECKICSDNKKVNTDEPVKPNTTDELDKPKVKVRHGKDILSEIWQTTTLPLIAFFTKVEYKNLLFEKHEVDLLKAVQPENDFLAYKSNFLYVTLLILTTIKRTLIEKNPFLKKHLNNINKQ